jgi:hypothetical protein
MHRKWTMAAIMALAFLLAPSAALAGDPVTDGVAPSLAPAAVAPAGTGTVDVEPTSHVPAPKAVARRVSAKAKGAVEHARGKARTNAKDQARPELHAPGCRPPKRH